MTEKTKTSGIKSWMNIFKGSKKRVNNDGSLEVTKARSTSSLSEKNTAGSVPTSMTRSSTTTTQSSAANKTIDQDDCPSQPTTKHEDGNTAMVDCVNENDPATVYRDNSLHKNDGVNGVDGRSEVKKDDSSAAVPTVEIFWAYGGEEVYVTGTFDGWSKSMKMEKQTDGRFMANIPANDTTILYKFVVDGVWKHDVNQPIEKDKDANINNVLQI